MKRGTITVSKGNYHHGDLRIDIINNGLLLLNKEGFQGFSLRKVASMCGVSHTAPYKHFKDKEDLIHAIIQEVSKKFYEALLEVTFLYPQDYKLRIVEIGKAYVKFMVENPDYLKLIFLSDQSGTVKIQGNELLSYEKGAFQVFKSSAEKYFQLINLDKALYLEKILSMWSLVHGIALLISKKNIEYEGDYLKLVEKMIITSLM